jgi:hypothetical protein
MTTYHLKLEAAAVHGLVEALRESGEDADGIQCGLESETRFTEMARQVVLGVLQDEAHAAALKETVAGLRARAGRLEARAERCRGALLAAFETLGLQRLTLPEATISVGRGRPDVRVLDPAVIPLAFRRLDPRLEAAWRGLLSAAAMLAAVGQEDASDQLRATASDLQEMATVDRKALLQTLKAGEPVPGTALSNGAPVLTVRVA